MLRSPSPDAKTGQAFERGPSLVGGLGVLLIRLIQLVQCHWVVVDQDPVPQPQLIARLQCQSALTWRGFVEVSLAPGIQGEQPVSTRMPTRRMIAIGRVVEDGNAN